MWKMECVHEHVPVSTKELKRLIEKKRGLFWKWVKHYVEHDKIHLYARCKNITDILLCYYDENSIVWIANVSLIEIIGLLLTTVFAF